MIHTTFCSINRLRYNASFTWARQCHSLRDDRHYTLMLWVWGVGPDRCQIM